MKRIAVFVALCSLLATVAPAQNGTGIMPQQRGGSSAARGAIIIDPDDYRYCTGFMLNMLFLSSGDFYLDMRGYLGLTAEQVSDIREIRIDFVRDTAGLRGELAAVQIELEDLLTDTTAGGNEIGRKIEDVFELEGEYQAARIAALLDARKVLTDEQRVMVEALRSGNRQAPDSNRPQDDDRSESGNGSR